MNVFKEQENLFGEAESFLPRDSLRTLFELAAGTRDKLGKKKRPETEGNPLLICGYSTIPW